MIGADVAKQWQRVPDAGGLGVLRDRGTRLDRIVVAVRLGAALDAVSAGTGDGNVPPGACALPGAPYRFLGFLGFLGTALRNLMVS